MTTSAAQVWVFDGLSTFRKAVGHSLGTSPWLEVTQTMIDTFAEATGDHQWIHVDPERAASGPFGGTIAHGYLTLSLVPALATSIYRLDGLSMVVNYGADEMRFPAPVRSGSRVRAEARLQSVEDGASGARARIRFTVEIEGQAKPACVVTAIYVLSE